MIWEVALLLLLFAYLGRWVLSGAAGRDAARLDPGHTAELARLREEMDQLSAQVARLQEEQSFTMRLLAEGGGAARAPALDAGGADPTTHLEKP
jgi:cell division protein FtsB